MERRRTAAEADAARIEYGNLLRAGEDGGPAQPVEQGDRIWYVADQDPSDGNGIFDGPRIEPGTALVEASALTTANQQIEELKRLNSLYIDAAEASEQMERAAEAKVEELTRERDEAITARKVAVQYQADRIADGQFWERRARAAEAQRDTLREGIESLSVECRQEAMTQRDDYAPTDNARSDAYAKIGGRLRSLLSTPPDKGDE